MREVLCADSRRLLTFHRWHKHAIIVDKRQRTVGAHHDIIGLYVAMSKWLGAKPSCHLAEAVAKHRHGVVVHIVIGDVCLHRLALNPVHKQYGKLFVLAVAVNEQFLLQILHGCDIRRVDKLQLLGNFTVCFCTTFLLFGEAL